ncbi:ABC transporter permease [Pigmentiphaga soli]|uniref:ABC transporter permease n=1 Tax=Pigmentiphaga soli TaxID=1007095 RepID=A0ABP8H073_9BURK
MRALAPGAGLLALAAWEVAVRALGVPLYLLPPPSAVAVALAAEPVMFLHHAVYTAQATLAGFALAVALGVAAAILIVQFSPVERTLYPFLVTLNSIPKVAVAPLFIVWMGTGLEPKVSIAAMIAIFPIVIDMVHALRSVDPDMIDLGRSVCGPKGMKILWRIRFPHSLPTLFASMKVAISLALIGAVVGEFVAAKRGLGYLILMAQGQFDVVRMFAAIAVLCAAGLALFYLVGLAERLLLPWQTARRAASAGH